MKVLMLPRFTANPYQDLLVGALRHFDVDVSLPHHFTRCPLTLSVLFRRRPDVLHIHWTHPYVLRRSAVGTWLKSQLFLLRVRIIKILGTRVVWTIHNLHNHEGRFRRLDAAASQQLAALADAMIVHSPGIKSAVTQAFQIRRPEKVTVIPHGHYIGAYPDSVSRSEARSRLGIAQRDRVLLYFGLIKTYKGVLDLVEAFARLGRRDTTLVIAGHVEDDDLAERLRSAAVKSTSVKLDLQYIPADSVQYYMRASDVVVLPFRDILTSASLILALSFGKAVVAPCFGYMQDVLGTEGAVLYSPGDRHGLEKALKQALAMSDVTLEEMGARNLEEAERNSWSKAARMTLDVYAGQS